VSPLWLSTLGLAQAAIIEGTVLDTSGAPVGDATVAAVTPWFSATRTTTSDDGHYRIEGLPAGEYRVGAAPQDGDTRVVRYHPSVRDYCESTRIRVYSETHRSSVDISLPTGASLQGRLLDVDGLPIEGASLTAYPTQGSSASRRGSTGPDGGFSLHGLDVAEGGAEEWRIRAAISGWPVQWLGESYAETEADVFEPTARGTTEIGSHSLLDGVLTGGQVTDSEGPLSEATVRVYSSGQLIQTRTDSTGRFEVIGLPPGDVYAWAEAQGRAVTYLPDADRPDEAIPLEEGGWTDSANIAMPAEATLTVQLRAEAEVDLAELSILLYNDAHTVGRGAAADSSGLATVDQLHGGDYHLFVYGADAGLADTWIRDADGELRVFHVDSEAATGPLRVELEASVRVEGSVIDEEGLPVANVAIIASLAEESEHAAEENSFFTHSDETGAFVLAGLPPGDWRVRSYVDPRCPSDPGFVPVYWPQQVDPARWEAASLQTGTPAHQIRFELPQDDDHDQMGDRWERQNGLSLTKDDGNEDPDQDGLSNLQEYQQDRDPQTPDGEWVTVRGCSCSSAAKASRLPLFGLLLLSLCAARVRT
jgi:hypothetical protein